MNTLLVSALTVLLLTGTGMCDLLGVIQVHRHGARTGKRYSDLTEDLFFGSSDTQLTINGVKQHESLGQWIAERYIHYDYQLLSRNFDKEEVIIKTSPLERTIFSAVAFIKGLYPHSVVVPFFKGNKGSEKKMKNNDLPPIPGYKLRFDIPEVDLIVEDPNSDSIFHAGSCKLSPDSSQKVKEQLIKTKIFNFTEDEIKEAINNIKSQWSLPFESKTEKEIYTKKFLKELNGFITPTNYHYDYTYFNLTKQTNDVLKKIQVEKWYSGRVEDSKALRLEVSGFFNEFLEYLDKFSRRKEDEFQKLKYVIYSGHDSSIISLIANFLSKEKLLSLFKDLKSSYNFLQPGFASHFNLELHYKDSKSYFLSGEKLYIRIVYNGNVVREGFRDELPYDTELDGINYEDFRNYLSSRIDESYTNLYCKRSGEEEVTKLASELEKSNFKLIEKI